MPAADTRSLSTLRPGKLKKYWGFFVWFNVTGVVAESFAALGFFILLQHSLFVDDFHLTTHDIGMISKVTVPILLGFTALHYLVVRHIINNHVLSFLPIEFFKEEVVRDPYERQPTRNDCISLQGTLHYWQLALGALVIFSYVVWGFIIWINYPDKVDLHLFLWIVGVGALVGLLYYLRLQTFDPTPLILGSRDGSRGALRSVQLIFTERDRRAAKSYRGRFIYLRIIKLIQYVTAWFLLTLGIAERQPPPPQRRRANEKAVGRAIDPEQLSGYKLQTILHILLLVALIIFTIRNFPEAEGAEDVFESRLMISIYVGVSVLSAVVMDAYRLLFRLFPRDPDDVVHRLCAEAFGIITESTSKTEHEAYLGRNDEKTALLRHWCFERRLTEAIVARNDENPSQFAVILVDIDNFKQVNTLFNYIAGDFLLWCVAQCVSRNVRRQDDGEDMVARYGGEELAVFLGGSTTDDAGRIAERIRQDIARSIRVDREGGRMVAWLEGPGGPRKHVIGEMPGQEALFKICVLRDEDPGALAPANAESVRHLLEGDDADGTVWTVTASVGVVDSESLPEALALVDAFDPGAPPDQRRILERYRMAYERIVELVGKCCLAAKQAGRDRTYVVREGDQGVPQPYEDSEPRE